MLSMETTDLKNFIVENRSDLIIKSDIIPIVYFSKSNYSSMTYLLDEDKKYAREEYWIRLEKDTLAIEGVMIIKNNVGPEGECINFDWD